MAGSVDLAMWMCTSQIVCVWGCVVGCGGQGRGGVDYIPGVCTNQECVLIRSLC